MLALHGDEPQERAKQRGLPGSIASGPGSAAQARVPQEQLARDAGVAAALRHLPQHVKFARREVLQRGGTDRVQAVGQAGEPQAKGPAGSKPQPSSRITRPPSAASAATMARMSPLWE